MCYKKCFAVAILAALASAEFLLTPSPKRGSGDGSDRDNAIYNDFISRVEDKIKTDVYTWMSKASDDDDTLVLHGESIIYGESLPPTFTYGFCLENNVKLDDKKMWDCQAILVELYAADAVDDDGKKLASQFMKLSDLGVASEDSKFDYNAWKTEPVGDVRPPN